MYEIESDGDEDHKAELNLPGRDNIKTQKQVNKDMQKKIILNEKHKFPILTEEERRQVRTFSKFEDDTSKNETHIMMKIASSKWNKYEFDISALQKAPININGKGDKDKIN